MEIFIEENIFLQKKGKSQILSFLQNSFDNNYTLIAIYLLQIKSNQINNIFSTHSICFFLPLRMMQNTFYIKRYKSECSYSPYPNQLPYLILVPKGSYSIKASFLGPPLLTRRV